MKKISYHVLLQVFCLISLFLSFSPAAHGATVTLQWDVNEPAPDGYRLFRRVEGESYDYDNPVYEGSQLTARVRCDEDTTYYFVVRAFLGSDESADSNEVSYRDNSGSDQPGGPDTDDPSSGGGSDGPGDAGGSPDGEAPLMGLTPALTTETSEPFSNHTFTRWQISTLPDFTDSVLDITSGTRLMALQVPDLVLDTDTRYYWRATYLDAAGNVIMIAAEDTFVTIGCDETEDVDSDGINDDQQVLDPFLDFDGNGVADIQQHDIMCVNTEDGFEQVGLKMGSPHGTLVSLKSIGPDGMSIDEDLLEITTLGMISFKILLGDEQDSATVTAYFSTPAPADTQWYKHDPENGWQPFEDVAFAEDRHSVTFTLVDGDWGDEDGVRNGIIVDPSGLGYATSTPWDDNCTAGSASSAGCFIGAAAEHPSELLANTSMALLWLLLLAVSVVARRGGHNHPSDSNTSA
jgi:hypothetical protein